MGVFDLSNILAFFNQPAQAFPSTVGGMSGQPKGLAAATTGVSQGNVMRSGSAPFGGGPGAVYGGLGSGTPDPTPDKSPIALPPVIVNFTTPAAQAAQSAMDQTSAGMGSPLILLGIIGVIAAVGIYVAVKVL